MAREQTQKLPPGLEIQGRGFQGRVHEIRPFKAEVPQTQTGVKGALDIISSLKFSLLDSRFPSPLGEDFPRTRETLAALTLDQAITFANSFQLAVAQGLSGSEHIGIPTLNVREILRPQVEILAQLFDNVGNHGDRLLLLQRHGLQQSTEPDKARLMQQEHDEHGALANSGNLVDPVQPQSLAEAAGLGFLYAYFSARYNVAITISTSANNRASQVARVEQAILQMYSSSTKPLTETPGLKCIDYRTDDPAALTASINADKTVDWDKQKIAGATGDKHAFDRIVATVKGFRLRLRHRQTKGTVTILVTHTQQIDEAKRQVPTGRERFPERRLSPLGIAGILRHGRQEQIFYASVFGADNAPTQPVEVNQEATRKTHLQIELIDLIREGMQRLSPSKQARLISERNNLDPFYWLFIMQEQGAHFSHKFTQRANTLRTQILGTFGHAFQEGNYFAPRDNSRGKIIRVEAHDGNVNAVVASFTQGVRFNNSTIIPPSVHTIRIDRLFPLHASFVRFSGRRVETETASVDFSHASGNLPYLALVAQRIQSIEGEFTTNGPLAQSYNRHIAIEAHIEQSFGHILWNTLSTNIEQSQATLQIALTAVNKTLRNNILRRIHASAEMQRDFQRLEMIRDLLTPFVARSRR